MGPPGAGKGTHAMWMAKDYAIPHISTGDMFREEISNQTELGKLAASYINDGHLVPDEVTIKMLRNRLAKPDCENGFLLDGFPRTIAQAEALESMSNEINRPIETVISLICDEAELIKRISGRRVCKVCGTPYHIINMKPLKEGICDKCGGELYQRKDDNEEALKVRLQHYTADTAPLLDFYKDRDLLVEYDSLVSSETLFDEVKKFLLS